MDRHILVVEDDLDGQEMVATILEHLEFAVDVADDGEQAATLLFDSGNTYQAVIIDLALPNKNGWELLEEIRSNSNTEHLPCIAVTAFHNSKLRYQALDAGFTAYIPKPVDSQQLRNELAELI